LVNIKINLYFCLTLRIPQILCGIHVYYCCEWWSRKRANQ